jgi:hypothetical protein
LRTAEKDALNLVISTNGSTPMDVFPANASSTSSVMLATRPADPSDGSNDAVPTVAEKLLTIAFNVASTVWAGTDDDVAALRSGEIWAPVVELICAHSGALRAAAVPAQGAKPISLAAANAARVKLAPPFRAALWAAVALALAVDLDSIGPTDGSGPRWGRQMRFPTLVTSAAGRAVNLRLWGETVRQIELLMRDGRWRFLRLPPPADVGTAPARQPLQPASSGLADAPPSATLLTIADWGGDGERWDGDVGQLTAAVHRRTEHLAACGHAPCGIIAGGDNFYPFGIHTVTDRRVANLWRRHFLLPADDTTSPSRQRNAAWGTVPWYVVLGNHDYMDCPQAQIDLTDSPINNAQGQWNMRGDDPEDAPYRNFAITISAHDCDVRLIVFDTNAAQFSVRRSVRDVVTRFHQDDVPWLRKELQGAIDAERLSGRKVWRVVISHQPMYTDGRGHASEALTLQKARYVAVGTGIEHEGLALESVFAEYGVHAHITGHEHVSQMTRKTYRGTDCLHAVAGAALSSDYWQGRLEPAERMVDVAVEKQCAFLELRATAAELRLAFIGVGESVEGQELYTDSIITASSA